MSAKVYGHSRVVPFQLWFPKHCRPRRVEEIRSWVDLPSALGTGTTAILARFPLLRLRVLYYILYPILYPILYINSIARPQAEPTPPVSWLGAVSCRLKQPPAQSDSERFPDAFIVVVRRNEMNLLIVYMLKVMRAEDSPLYLDESSACAGCAAMPDGNFVVLSNENTPIQIENSKYDEVEGERKYKLDLSFCRIWPNTTP